ncbi:MAG: carbohydrate kinase [Firmicutes bacterium]|nr:carbohydrate kinase [Bacillota bacterium]
MGESIFIGIDIGTQSLRTGFFEESGNCITFASQEYELESKNKDWYKQAAKAWWSAFKNTLNECFEKAGDNFDRKHIKALACCATSSTVLPVDKDGNSLEDAILWMDQRAYKETAEINKTGHKILNYCGGEVSSEWMVPKLLWYKKNEQDIYEKADYIVEQLDWFNYKLTKKWVVSKCNATCKWNYLDINTGWNEKFMSEIGLSDYKSKWPDKVVSVGSLIGFINDEVAESLSLPRGIEVYQGGIDAHIALLGMGVTNTDELGLIMGSSFVHLTFSDNPIFNQGIWGPYSNAILDDLWLLEGGQVSGASINRWFKDNFGQDFEGRNDDFYEVLSKQAASIPPGSEGLIVLDFWEGNRTPYKDSLATGNILGLKLKHRRSHVYRAILEGIAYGTRNAIENMESENKEIEKIIVCGGASKDPLWLQIIADVTGREVITTQFEEAGILGNAIIASAGYKNKSISEIASKMVKKGQHLKPNKRNYNIYKTYFELYKRTYGQLSDLMKILSKLNE